MLARTSHAFFGISRTGHLSRSPFSPSPFSSPLSSPFPPPPSPSHHCLAAPPLVEWVVDQSRIIGIGIGAFVLFYSSLNWMFYNRLRREAEDAMDDASKGDDEASSEKK